MPGFLRLRTRTVKKRLKALDESCGTGPDLLPARVLKKCADVLALPITLLTRKLLREGQWPACWRNHWARSIYKKGNKAEAKNDRGVHLTAQLSKVVERACGNATFALAIAVKRTRAELRSSLLRATSKPHNTRTNM